MLVVGEGAFELEVRGGIVRDHRAGLLGLPDGLARGHAVFDGRVVGHVAAGGGDPVSGRQGIHEVHDGLHVVLLVPQQHHGGKWKVAAYHDSVAVGDRLGLGQVDVLVYRDAVGLGQAHGLDVHGGVPADEEGAVRSRPLDGREQFGEGFFHELGEVGRRNLAYQRIDDRDHVHAGLRVVARDGHGDLVGVGKQGMGVVGFRHHVHEELGPAQVGREGERSGHQAVQRGRVPDGFLHAAHRLKGERNAAFGLSGYMCRDGHRFRQGMARDRGRAVFRPYQLAAEDLGFDLQIEHDRLAVGPVHPVDLQQGLHEDVDVAQGFARAPSDELARVGSCEGHPGGAFGRLMGEDVFHELQTCHGSLLIPGLVDMTAIGSKRDGERRGRRPPSSPVPAILMRGRRRRRPRPRWRRRRNTCRRRWRRRSCR